MKPVRPNTTQTAEHYAYVLRQWRESQTAHWRYSLHIPDSDERHGFADLEQLVAYLRQCPNLPTPLSQIDDRFDDSHRTRER